MKTLKEAQAVLQEVHGLIRYKMGLVPILRYTYHFQVFVQVNTYDYDCCHSDFENLTTSLAKKVAFMISENEKPTHRDNAKEFCEFMEFTSSETDEILKLCLNDKDFNQWEKSAKETDIDWNDLER
jgi:hypothetical protein